jgi:hypothetical protein
MKTRFPILTLEHLLYLLIVGVALGLRLYQLGAYPLAEPEAREALLAWQWVRGLPVLGAPHSPAYFFFASLSFFLGGAGDLLARLVPALAGASLALLPLLFRDRLGRAEAVLTSLLLALSAGLVAASRTADGTMLTLVGLGWGWGLLRRYLANESVPALAGSAALLGLGLASGAPFLTGATVGLLAILLVAGLNPGERPPLTVAWAQVRKQALVFFGTLGVSCLLVATVGLTYLPGLGALAESWQTWLAGFLPSALGRPLWLYLLFMVAYEPLLLVFGLVGVVGAFRQRSERQPAVPETPDQEPPAARPAPRVGWAVWLAGLAVAALALSLIFSGRALTMVVWVIAPLAALAAGALVAIVRRLFQMREWPQMVVQMVLILALLVFAGIRLTAFVADAGAPAGPVNVNVSLAVLALLMAVGITLLFGAGWSWKTAAVGATLSVTLALAAVSLNALWGLTQTRPTSPTELWWQNPTADTVNRLVQSVSRISNSSVGTGFDVQLTVQSDTPQSPGWVLRWAFRNFTHATFVAEVTPQTAAGSVVVVAPATVPGLLAAYVGQTFAFQRSWGPDSLSGIDWVAWALYRRAPTTSDQLILWMQAPAQP